MVPAALAGLCALLMEPATHDAGLRAASWPPQAVGDPAAVGLARIRSLVDRPDARDGIARVAYAEAGNQGDSGLAAVVYTILNRLEDGRWGGSVDAVLDGRSQFEPVSRAGGHWRGLSPVSAPQQARIDTILNLVLDGRLPDLTGGARYFQNPAIVAARARAGQVSPGLVNFGGAAPSAVIGAHRFYVAAGPSGHGARAGSGPSRATSPERLFIGENRATDAPSAGPAGGDATGSPSDPSQALFVRLDGRVAGP